MNTTPEEPTAGRKAARAVGGTAVELAAGIGQALLEFVVLGLLLLVAGVLVLYVDPYVGFGFGAISFIVWSVKTGWTFW